MTRSSRAGDWYHLPVTQRVVEPELMDDPALDEGAHVQALRGLARINRVGNAVGMIYGALRDLFESQQPLRILDVATGSGDVLIGLARRVSRGGVRHHMLGCDVSAVAVARARQRAGERGEEVEFVRLDVLSDPLPSGFDVVLCSLFLHHLRDADAERMLARMVDAARRRVVVSDLSRSAPTLALVWVASRVLTTSPIVRVDAIRSARAAFTIEEARSLAERAGIAGARVSGRFPCRWLLRWDRG